jgi:exonuclease VII small subunit
MQMNFNDYWDTRIEANPGPCKHNPGIMNFAYSEALHLYEHMMENLRQAELRAVKAEQRLKTIRNLCGYVEDGTNASVHIGQDDATKTWSICYSRQYKSIAWADTFEQMLDKAGEALAKLEARDEK